MSRIKLTDSLLDVLVNMSEGNPGALTALMDISKVSPEVDPKDAFPMGLGVMMHLDALEIYGSHIWILYSDVCDRSAHKLCLLVRAYQLGKMPKQSLKDLSIDHPNIKKDCDKECWAAWEKDVREVLPEFKPLED